MRTNIRGVVILRETSVSVAQLMIVDVVVGSAKMQSIVCGISRRNFKSSCLSVVEICIAYGICAHRFVADVVVIPIVKQRSREIQSIDFIFC